MQAALIPSVTTRKPCKGFRWIGQSWKHCESCGEPYWEHTYDERIKPNAGPFDEKDCWEYVLISEEVKAKVKARYQS